MKETKKITRATFKSFLKKNQGRVLIKSLSTFDGMSDMVEFSRNPQWMIPKPYLPNSENTLGLAGS